MKQNLGKNFAGRSQIISNPNCGDDEESIVRLVGQIITVSLETQAIVAGLPQLQVGTIAQ